MLDDPSQDSLNRSSSFCGKRKRPGLIMPVVWGHCSCMLMIAAVTSLVACSSWDPPVFSPELSDGMNCSATTGQDFPVSRVDSGSTKTGISVSAGRLETSVSDVELVRKRYIQMARCLTKDTNLSGVALVGLSSAALFLGMTSPHPKDLAGLGVVGGATYLYGGGANSAIGQRRLVYYAGADALSCSLKAAEPYRQAGASSSDSLEIIRSKAITARDGLDMSEHRLQVIYRTPVEQKRAVRRPEAGCSQLSMSSCRQPGAGASSIEKAQFETCKILRDRCASTSETSIRLAPHPAVKATLDDIVKARDDINKLLAESVEMEANAEMTAMLLREQSARIQIQVAREVDKTYPDLAAVLNSAGVIKTVGFKVSDAPGLGSIPVSVAQDTGQVQSDKSSPRYQDPPADLETARTAMTAAIRAATELRLALLHVKRRVSFANTDLRNCGLTMTPLPGGSGTTGPDVEGSATRPTPAGGTGTAEAMVVTADLDPLTIAPLLGLQPSASGNEVQAAVQRCQQNVLNRSSATGVTIDPETMQTLLKGGCKGGRQ